MEDHPPLSRPAVRTVALYFEQALVSYEDCMTLPILAREVDGSHPYASLSER